MRREGLLLGLWIFSCSGSEREFPTAAQGGLGGENSGGEASGGNGPSASEGGQLAAEGGQDSSGGSLGMGVAGELGQAGKEQAAGGQGGTPSTFVGCDVSTPFGKPTVLFKANATKRESGRFWPDERSIYFVVAGDIFNASRSSTLVGFPDGAALNINTVSLELAPLVASDGKTLYFNASQDGVMKVAQRVDASGEFDPPDDVAGLKPYPDSPYLAGNDDVLYYDAFDDQLSKRHIWRATLTEFGFADNEVQLPETATFRPTTPVVSRDQLRMYFAGTEPGVETSIYVATRSAVGEPFGEPWALDELNTAEAFDRPNWLSEDGCRLVVESDQTLYLAVKTR